MTNDITLTKNNTVVTIGTTKVEETKLKKITPVVVPTSTINWGDGPKNTIIVDLLMIESRFTVDGIISEDLGSGDSNSAVGDKRTDLIDIFQAGGVIVMAYAGTNYNINIDKLQVTEEREDAGAGQTPDNYKIKFTCIVGVDYGS